MNDLETRYPCPICIGATLLKSEVVIAPRLVIDHCPRCGGVWFDFGEIQQLRRCQPAMLWELVAPHTHVHQMQCHGCHAHLTRNDAACPNCQRANEIDCPKCGQPMHAAFHGNVRLDACTHCKGVWFDRHELEEIWRIELDAALRRRSQLYRTSSAKDAPLVLLDALTFDPWVTYYGVQLAAHAGAGAVEMMGSAPEMAAGAGEVVAEAAAGVFETIVEIIASIFG